MPRCGTDALRLTLVLYGHEDHDRWEALSVGEVMRREPVCVKPSSSPLWALKIMRSFGIGALPVVDDGRLVGLVTEHDFLDIAGKLLLDELERASPVTDEPEP